MSLFDLTGKNAFVTGASRGIGQTIAVALAEAGADLALVPELDDYLRPDEARARFARVPQAEVVAVDRAKHLWVGEPYVRIVLNEIVRRVNPSAWPLPTEWQE